jgi:hypothetical protein
MSFKIKDGVRIGTVDVFNNAGGLLVAAPSVANSLTAGTGLTGGPYNGSGAITLNHSNSVVAATVNAGSARTLAYAETFNVPSITYDAQGHITGTTTVALTLPAAAAAANNGTLTLSMGTAAVTGAAVTIGTGTGFSANTASNLTYDVKVGPSLTALATLMATAGVGFIKRGATADTYTIDTNTYLTGNQTITVSGDANGSGTTAITLTLANSGATAGTYNNVTVNAKGLVTSGSNVAYLTSYTETDTLQTVTTRGATSNVATISLTANTASSGTGSGTLVVTGGVGIGGNLNVGGNFVLTGNLTVNGTTTTVNSTTTTLDDPILTLGGDTAPVADDNKDRGIEFRYFDTAARVGFFGYDDSSGKYTFLTNATNTAEVFTGTKATLDAHIEYADILSKPTLPVKATSTVLGLVELFSDTVQAEAAQAVTTTTGRTYGVQLNSADQAVVNVPWTDTPANNGTLAVSIGVAAATGTAIAWGTTTGHSANASGNSTYDLRVGPAVTNLAAFMTTATAGFIKRTAQDTYTIDTNTYLTANQSISLTGDATGTGTTSIPVVLATVNSNVGTFNSVTVNGKGLVTAASNVAYLTAESDTLQSVTTRGNTTNLPIILNASSTNVSSRLALSVAVPNNTQLAVDSWAIATFRAAKYLVQITQGSNVQISELLVLHNGASATTETEYAVLETAGVLGNFVTDINSGNVRLLLTLVANSAATVRIDRTAMYL